MQTSVKTPRSSSSTSWGWTCPRRRSIKREEESQEKLWHDETEIHIKPFCPEPVLLYNAAVQFCTIQCCTIYNCTIQYTLHYSTVQYSTQYSAVLHVLSPNRTLCLSLQPRKGGDSIGIHNRKPSPKNARGPPESWQPPLGYRRFDDNI